MQIQLTRANLIPQLSNFPWNSTIYFRMFLYSVTGATSTVNYGDLYVSLVHGTSDLYVSLVHGTCDLYVWLVHGTSDLYVSLVHGTSDQYVSLVHGLHAPWGCRCRTEITAVP